VRRLNGHAVEIVLVGILHDHRHDIALRQMPGVAQMDLAVDLGRVGLAPAGGAAFGVGRVDDDVDRPADLRRQFRGGNCGSLSMKRA
jgi:hypothetical protein